MFFSPTVHHITGVYRISGSVLKCYREWACQRKYGWTFPLVSVEKCRDDCFGVSGLCERTEACSSVVILCNATLDLGH